jgi:hypothetical protein
MGAKYLPTIKDQKASQRFQRQQKQKVAPKPAKAARGPAKKKT